jgi:hypothetical protein
LPDQASDMLDVEGLVVKMRRKERVSRNAAEAA